MNERLRFTRPLYFAAALLTAVCCWGGPGLAAPDRDKNLRWRQLIAEAIKHAGVETISGDAGSYVFAGPNGWSVTFTRTLDDRKHFVCAAYMAGNIIVCGNWDTEKLRYGMRADEGSAWVFSDAPPAAAASASQPPFWLSLLAPIFDSDVPFDTPGCWRRRCWRFSSRNGFGHRFGHGY